MTWMHRQYKGDKRHANIDIQRWHNIAWIAWIHVHYQNRQAYRTEILGGTLNEIRKECEKWITDNIPEAEPK